MHRPGCPLLAAFFCLSAAVVIVGQTVTITFDKYDPGALPKGLAFAVTGQGKPGV